MKPRIERVPDDYDPRYPRALERAEYEEWLAPDQRQRILAAATAAASLALATGRAAQSGGAAGSERVEAVLRVLTSGAAGGSGWFHRSSFERGKDPQGNPTVLPRIPIMFGNSQNGVFDANRARALASELFAAYGLQPGADHRVAADGVEATIDLYDPERRVGVELRGALEPLPRGFAKPEEEPAGAALDDVELARLAASGYRIQRVDLFQFPLMDGDQATPTLAYLAGIVEFLNEVAGGPEVDLTAVLAMERMRIALPEAQVDSGVRCMDGHTFEADAEATLTFALDPAQGYERAVASNKFRRENGWHTAEPAPKGSGPLLIEVRARRPVALTVEQDGARPLRIEAAGSLAFLPPRFDPNRPFRVTLRLQPGSTEVEPHLVLYGLPR